VWSAAKVSAEVYRKPCRFCRGRRASRADLPILHFKRLYETIVRMAGIVKCVVPRRGLFQRPRLCCHRICEMADAELVQKIPLRMVIGGETVPPKFQEQL